MKGRKTTVLILVTLLSLSIPAAFSSNDSFAVEYQFNAVVVNDQWVIEGTILQEIPGEPLIPFYPARILLPQDAEVKDVKVKSGIPVIQEGFDIAWGQPPCTFSSAEAAEKVGKNEQIYNSNNWYPEKLYEVLSIESFRGFQILNVMLYPLQYKPKSKTVKFYLQLTVDVQFGKGLKNKLYRGLQGDKQAVSGMVDNPDMVAAYAEPAEAVPFLTGGPYQYIIITNSTLAPAFQELLLHKIDYVNRAKIIDVAWIYSNYTGYDNPEKIRNFIIDAYNDWDTEYCLLGGDIAAVPYRGFYIYANGYYDYDMAADMYFGCLDGNFDADGDHVYGEPNDGVDWLEEVFIGRAPVETVSEAELFVDKVINYELAVKPKVCQFHAAIIAPGNNPDSRTIPWNCEQWVPEDYTIKELFEQNGPITKDDWRDAWDGSYDGEPHVPPLTFQHAGHGSTTCYGISSSVNWCNADVSTLTNTFWPIHMSVACHSGNFKYNDCLAETYVKDDCGAIACMLNVNYGWFSTLDASKYSGDFLETMFRGLFDDGKEHLGELLNQAKSYWVSHAQSNSTYRWCYYEINLLGDPESPCLTKRRPVTPPTVIITNPPDGSIVSGTVEITVRIGPLDSVTPYKGKIDTVEFYIDNVLVYTDTVKPFVYEWDTTDYHDGRHTIYVKGYYSDIFRDDDIVTVNVNNSTEPYVRITNPQHGSTVSGIVLVTTETAAVDTVKFYINGELVYTCSSEPFEFKWDTTEYEDGTYEILAEGYQGNTPVAKDAIKVTVRNAV
ncbi:MAG: hypothetical protein HXS48_11315 [Theionarchaea archaeon]|nr:MAG: hypothetical protein AYK19_18595 [Theionarchaea archaeon DG-70-1]MBU7027515.1 hypothetical protein [Theionarchaea archaeon]